MILRFCCRHLSTKSSNVKRAAPKSKKTTRFEAFFEPGRRRSRLNSTQLSSSQLYQIERFLVQNIDFENEHDNCLISMASQSVVLDIAKYSQNVRTGSDLFIADDGALEQFSKTIGATENKFRPKGYNLFNKRVILKPSGHEKDGGGPQCKNVTLHPDPVILKHLFRYARKGQQYGEAGPPSPLYSLGQLYSSESKNIDPSSPPFTIVAMCDQELLSYMAKHALNSTNPLNYRPEMFLILDPYAFFELCGGIPTMSKGKNDKFEACWLDDILVDIVPFRKRFRTTSFFLFRMLFDTCLLNLLPAGDLAKAYPLDVPKQYRDKLMLVQSRRKEFPANAQFNLYLMYFAERLGKGPVLRTRIVSTLDSFIDGLGLELINLGYNVNTMTHELRMEDMLTLYNKLVSHPKFENSSFKDGAEVKLNSLRDSGN